MTRKWNLPLTYEPKIEPVRRGDCTQTIRICKPNKPKKQIGDLVRFYIWEGRPYWSKRTRITDYMPIYVVIDCIIYPDSFERIWKDGSRTDHCRRPWSEWDCIADRDGIVPPTGVELKRVLAEKNKIPDNGINAQIIRWKA